MTGVIAMAALLFTAAAAEEPAMSPGDNTKPASVLLAVGGHKYDEAAFHAVFDADDGIDTTVAEVGKPGRGPFADIEEWGYDVVALYCHKRELSETERENLVKLLGRGTGLVVLHHGMMAFPDWPKYAEILGARFFHKKETYRGKTRDKSTWKHDQDLEISVADTDHPITRGLPKTFEVRDETYGDWLYFEGNHLLLVTDHPENNREVAWTRRYRGSRVFYLQLGHGPEAMKHPVYRKLLARGIRWAAGRTGSDDEAERDDEAEPATKE